MDKPLIAPGFRASYANLQQHLPQALLLAGIDGVGLKYLARSLSTHLEAVVQPLNSKGDIDSVNGSISIEVVRDLYQQTRSRGKDAAQVIIADADQMTKPAQQAFLKLLEEPPRGISFILTSHHQDALLSTIRSRVQTATIPPISSAMTQQLLAKHHLDAATTQQLLFAADGRPGLLTRLIRNPHQRAALVALVRDARDFIAGQGVKRLTVAFRYNDRQRALTLLDAALMLHRFSITRHAEPAEIASIAQALTSYRNIAAGGNVRLNLLHVMV